MNTSQETIAINIHERHPVSLLSLHIVTVVRSLTPIFTRSKYACEVYKQIAEEKQRDASPLLRIVSTS